MIRYLVILGFCLLPFTASAEERLAYYSDYFSFVGRDQSGYVLFALDNNRGVDGDAYQAEHFGVLYSQFSGWMQLAGTGAYANEQKELARIPDSAEFHFRGTPDSGMTIRSQVNKLELRIDPIAVRLSESAGKRNISWGSAGAILSLQDRTITGRVIYEHLVHLDWNRLTHTYAGRWNNFQGFYLVFDKGEPGQWQDLYLRSEGEGEKRPGKGFVTAGPWHGEVHSSRFQVLDTAFALGFYRWPQRWSITIEGNKQDNPASGRLELQQINRQNEGNWLIGGFAMSVVSGKIIINGSSIPVLGFAELIK